MGVGKTTIGRHLAQHYGCMFKDSDKEIEDRTGASIPLIFEYEGEAGFRKRETAMIIELTQQKNLILATGGGVVLAAENRHYLRQNGYVLYLHASVETLLSRTEHCQNRPLLQSAPSRAEKRQRIETLLQQRHPLYSEVADLIIDTGAHAIVDVVRYIIRQLDKRDVHENLNG